MFDFDAGKLLIIGIVALVFIPSKDLPRVLRQLGQFVAKMRRMASEFQGQFMDAMREADLAELRREADNLAKAASVGVDLHPIHELKTKLTSMIEGKPALSLGQAEALGAASEVRTIAPPDFATSGSAEADLREAAKPSSVTVEQGGIDVSAVAEPAQGAPVDHAAHAVARGA